MSQSITIIDIDVDSPVTYVTFQYNVDNRIITIGDNLDNTYTVHYPNNVSVITDAAALAPLFQTHPELLTALAVR